VCCEHEHEHGLLADIRLYEYERAYDHDQKEANRKCHTETAKPKPGRTRTWRVNKNKRN
jgi:hypothetical protein